MRLIFEPFTDAATYTILDQSIAELLRKENPEEDSVEVFDSHSDKVIQYSNAHDGSIIAHVYIDEDPPKVMFDNAFGRVENMRLPLPTGKLLFCGAEYALESDNERPQSVPPGTYSATGFNIEWAEDQMSAEVQALRRRRRWQFIFYPLGCFSFIAAIVALLVIFFSTTNTTPWWWLLLFSLGIQFVCGFTVTSKGFTLVEKHAREASREYPEVVLILKLLPEGESAAIPDKNKFGPAHTGEWE